MSRYRSFSAQVEAFEKLSKKRLTEVFSGVAVGMLREVHRHSVVLTGWSRASWIISVGSKARGVYSYSTGKFTTNATTWRGNKPPKGVTVDPPAPESQKLRNIKLTDRIYLTNNVFYIGTLEEKYGMLAAAAAFGRREVSRIAREINK